MGLQVELLQESFQAIAPRGGEFVASFYERLFRDYPDTKSLFANTSMPEQQNKLLMTLVLVMENLTKGDVLTEALHKLGASHVRYAVLPEHYAMVGGALLGTFAEYLGADWTPQLEAAWTEAYGAITSGMLAAYPAEAGA